MSQPKVSIVVPVYKAELYIEKCVRSLFEQTLDNLEYIFIDDCSPDKSIEILFNVLENFPVRKSQIKLIRHDKNQGVSSSRQDGVNAAEGEYIIHCDPDDWVELDMYESLYKKAKEEDADIVISDFFKVKGNDIRYYKQKPIELNSISVLECISDRNSCNLHGSTWNKLIRTNCCQGAIFPDDISFCEDVYFWFQILKHKVRIQYLNKSFYYYRDNPISIVHTPSDVSLNNDLNLIKRLNKLSIKSNSIRYVECCNSVIIGILMRFFFYSKMSNEEFKQNFRQYSTYLNLNHRYNFFYKILLYISMHGYFCQSQSLWKRLKRIKQSIRKLIN